MKFGVVIFPGSNCDQDCLYAVQQVAGQDAVPIWHQSTDLNGLDCVILPGGFSYGDYLRCGALASQSPVMQSVKRFAASGGLVLGICNGWQILLEAGLLPGALLRNRSLKFRCRYVTLRVDSNQTPFTSRYSQGQLVKIPIAHGEGNYFIDKNGLAKLRENRQIVFTYTDDEGKPTDEANPNGSVANIAGICNPDGNVLGMMPHPERAVEAILGSTDGAAVFASIVDYVAKTQPTQVRATAGGDR